MYQDVGFMLTRDIINIVSFLYYNNIYLNNNILHHTCLFKGRSATKGDCDIALPGDNPVYELSNGCSTAFTVGNRTQVQEQVHVLYVNQNNLNLLSVTNRSRAETELDHEFDNPIYSGNPAEMNVVYSDADTHGIGIGSSPYHKFENPIYGDDAEVNNTYTALNDCSSQRPSAVYSTVYEEAPLTSSELVYDTVDQS